MIIDTTFTPTKSHADNHLAIAEAKAKGWAAELGKLTLQALLRELLAIGPNTDTTKGRPAEVIREVATRLSPKSKE